MKVPSQDSVQRCADALPLLEQLAEQTLAVVREPVEAFVALVLFAPLARQKPPRLEAPKQRVERALVHGEPALGKCFAQRVSVLLVLERGHDREHQASSAQLEPQVFVGIGRQAPLPVSHIVCATQYSRSRDFSDNGRATRAAQPLLVLASSRAGSA